MAQTNLSIRMDEDLKKQFNALCEDLGMSMTTAMCIFAKKQLENAISHLSWQPKVIPSIVMKIWNGLHTL